MRTEHWRAPHAGGGARVIFVETPLAGANTGTQGGFFPCPVDDAYDAARLDPRASFADVCIVARRRVVMAAIVGVVCDQGGAAAVLGVRDESFAAIGVARYPSTAVARLACCSGAPDTYASARYEHGQSVLALVGASPAHGKDASRHTVGRAQPVQRAVATRTGLAGSARLAADDSHASTGAALRHAHEHVAIVRVGALHQGRVGHGHVGRGRRPHAGHDD